MSDIRDKFLEDLRVGLINSKVDNAEEILNKYVMQYDDRIAKGLTDMEVVIALGDPSDIIQALSMPDENSHESLERKLSQSVADLLGSDPKKQVKALSKGNKSKEKDKKRQNKQKKSSKDIPSHDNLEQTVSSDNAIEQDIAEEQGITTENPPLRKKNVFVRILLFFTLTLLAFAIPLSLMNAGLNYLDTTTFTMEVIISLAIGVSGLILFLIIRKVTKNHIINGN